MKEEREPKMDPAVNCTDMAAFLLLHRLREAPVRLQSFRGYAGLCQVRALYPEPRALPCDPGQPQQPAAEEIHKEIQKCL